MVRVHVRPPSPPTPPLECRGPRGIPRGRPPGGLFGNRPRARAPDRSGRARKVNTDFQLATEPRGAPTECAPRKQGQKRPGSPGPPAPGAMDLAPRLYGRMADALAAAGEEGRGKLR